MPQWAAHKEPRAYNFTERRMLWLIDWVTKAYHVDPNRVYAEGGSMGAWGTATFALRHPDVFAAVYPNRPRTIQRGLPSLATIARDLQVMMDDGQTDYYERMNMVKFVRRHPDDLPFIGWCCGRYDGFASFKEQIEMVKALTAAHHGFAFAWNNGDHGTGAKPMSEIRRWYPPEKFARNQSYPAFGNSSIDDDLGTGEIEVADGGRAQAHGGSCFDSKRGRLILFGSDTHGRDWTNSPLFFDVASRAWSRAYPNDERATYGVTDDGVPVAGANGEHPWATHTFGTVMYDPSRYEMIIACAPKHMVPGRFTDSVKDLWPKIKRHPTWTFSLETRQWRPLLCEAVDFFPHSAAFDTDRKVVLGYRPDGIYELAGEPRTWKRLTTKVFFGGWHSNCVYDAKNKALVIFGTNTNSNDIEVFYPATGKHQLMPTVGLRPPKDQHNPMAFHARLGTTVVIVDYKLNENQTVAETWLYDLADDSWSPASNTGPAAPRSSSSLRPVRFRAATCCRLRRRRLARSTRSTLVRSIYF